MGQYGITLWLPTHVKNAGISGNLNIGMVTVLPYVAAGISMIVFGVLSDRTARRRWYLMPPLLLGAIGFVGTVMFENNTVLAILALVIVSIAAPVLALLSPVSRRDCVDEFLFMMKRPMGADWASPYRISGKAGKSPA